MRSSAESALEQLPGRQAAWVTAQGLTGALLGGLGLATAAPELVLATTLGAGVATVGGWRRLWSLPLVVAVVGGTELAADALGLPGLWVAALVAGLLAVVLMPMGTDALDALNGALGTAAGTALGVWSSVQLVPDLGPIATGGLGAALVGLVASQGLVIPSIRLDEGVPSAARIRRELGEPYRPRALEALTLFARARSKSPDRATRRGLEEVVRWVFSLQKTLQNQDRALADIDPLRILERIEACTLPTEDDFTRDRQLATVGHLQRLLEHRQALERERGRTDALADYALAFLEEARAGLLIAEALPSEQGPARLDEVLERLRSHTLDGEVRRRTERELARA